MNLKINGIITHIGEAEQISDKFTLRKFAVESLGRYPQPIVFQLTQDRCDLIEPYNVGDGVIVFFDIQGNKVKEGKHKGRIFNNLNAWKIEVKGEQEAFFTPPAPADQSFPDEDKTPF